jgi:hypothetical protein
VVVPNRFSGHITEISTTFLDFLLSPTASMCSRARKALSTAATVHLGTSRELPSVEQLQPRYPYSLFYPYLTCLVMHHLVEKMLLVLDSIRKILENSSIISSSCRCRYLALDLENAASMAYRTLAYLLSREISIAL